tara:strand:- start:18752 stop:18925 length:174 start_codon:yes stop_codon:yes gene_type:complete
MDKNKLAAIITRLHFCNDSKLENLEDWEKMKVNLLNLDDDEFDKELSKFGLLDKEAS